MSTTLFKGSLRTLKSNFRCLVLLFFLALLVSCGDEEEVIQTTPVAASPTAPLQDPLPPLLKSLPCFTDYTVTPNASPPTAQTTETVHIQMFERPYRIVPNDIVLRLNRPYRLVIQANDEWQHFASRVLSQDIHLPPYGQAEVLLQPREVGVFPIENNRNLSESELQRTITVIPEGMVASSWHPLCAEFSVHSPQPGANLSTPLVIQGSFKEAEGSNLHVTRLEAWSNGRQVGHSTREHFIRRGSHSEFFLSISDLPPGAHSLLLRAVHQNGTLAATAILPLNILPNSPTGATAGGYQGTIDLPGDNALLGLPVTIQGWVVIPGSTFGAGVGTVEIWSGPRESGRLLTEAIYGIFRPDVAQALREPRFASSGFFAQLSDLPAGPIDLHVYVRDRRSGEYVSPRFRQSPLTRRVTLAEGKVTDAAWPVSLVSAPDGRLFFAELLTGNIRILQDGQVLPKPFATLNDVSNYAESGLLSIALHPDYPQTPEVYAMYVVDNPETGFALMQRVVRFRDVNNTGQDFSVILDNLPATTTGLHNGGRIAFGPDGKLYLSIGDTDVPDLAQDPTNYAGSVLRFNPDGSIPDDNPIPGSPVYAIGLRNVFGLAFQPTTGVLYATENGPGGFDEINRIQAGDNYGWPLHMGTTNAEGITDPIAVFGTWPQPAYGPTGATFPSERPELLLFCAFHVPALHALELGGSNYESVERELTLSKHCILDTTASNDGWVYYSTISAIYRARLNDLLRLEEHGRQDKE